MLFQKKYIKPALLGLSLIALGACQHTDVAMPSPLDAKMRNSVQMVRLSYEIRPEEDQTDTPSVATINSLNAFLFSVKAGYGDVIMIDSDSAPSARKEAIEEHLHTRGLTFGGEATLGGAPKNGAIMLYVERYVVTTPNCGNWPAEVSNNQRNNTSSFYGCSNVSNLGLMVANPRDLIAGQDGGNSTAAAVGAIYSPSPQSSGPSVTMSFEGLGEMATQAPVSSGGDSQ